MNHICCAKVQQARLTTLVTPPTMRRSSQSCHLGLVKVNPTAQSFKTAKPHQPQSYAWPIPYIIQSITSNKPLLSRPPLHKSSSLNPAALRRPSIHRWIYRNHLSRHNQIKMWKKQGSSSNTVCEICESVNMRSPQLGDHGTKSLAKGY